MKLLAFDTVPLRWCHVVVTGVSMVCYAVAALAASGTAMAAESVKKVEKPKVVALTKKKTVKATPSRTEIKSKAAQLAAGIRAAEAALSPAELAIARLIHVGSVACELGVTIDIKADERAPGYFDLTSKKFKFRMFPVVSSTGAIRLQDAHTGAVWLQLANKSMLMSQKLGARLADACMNPTQMVVAAEMEKNPPTSLLEPVKADAQPTPESVPRVVQAEKPAAVVASSPATEKAVAEVTTAELLPPQALPVSAVPVAVMPAQLPSKAIQ